MNDALASVEQLLSSLTDPAEPRSDAAAHIQQLLQSPLLTLTAGGQVNQSVLTGGQAAQVLLSRDPQGKLVWPIFTDPAAVAKWKPQAPCWATAKLGDWCGLFLQTEAAEMWINPGSPRRWVLSRQDVASLRDGRVPPTVASETPEYQRTLFAKPKQPPPEDLQNRLEKKMAEYLEISAGYLLLAQTNSSSRPQWAAAVRLRQSPAMGNVEQMMDQLRLAGQQTLPPGQKLHMLLLDEGTELAIGQVVRPIYQCPGE